MKNKQRELLNRSFAWIREHLNATTRDVPAEFLTEWSFKDDEEYPKPEGFFMSVFAFGHLQHELLTGDVPPGEKLTMPVELLYERFGMWQRKLGLAQVNRMTNLQIEPLVLFGFPEGEEVRYFPRRSDAKAEANN